MNINEIAVSVKNVSKDFRLPHEKADSIKSLFVNPFNKGRHNYEMQHALHEIDFEIKKGEFYGIVGRNGSGKSTLLKIIAGIYQPTKGKVTINGRLVPFIELGVGFNPELTGRENVYLNGALMGFSEKEVNTRYYDIVKFSELERFMDQKLKNYSSGMQVRLAFSVATILADSDILLIDEVLAVGDSEFQRKCFEYFRSLKRKNKTVIFVSHDMNAIREYCDKVILIDNSRIIARGTAQKVAREYDKLFISEINTEQEESKKQSRWGNGAVKYKSVKIEPSKVISDEPTIILKTKLKAYQDVDGIVVGFSIRNSADSYIVGTNTTFQGKKIRNLKKGDEFQIDWTIPNIFSDGTYVVNTAIETDALEPCDWWDEAVTMTIVKATPKGFVASPNINVSITRE